MKLINQKPGDLEPANLSLPIGGDFDPMPALEKLVERACYQPLVPTAPMQALANGQDISLSDMTALIATAISDENADPVRDGSIMEFLGTTLLRYDKLAPLAVDEMFVNQAAVREGLDWPDSNTVYTPATDIIPTAGDLLAGNCTFDCWFASLALFARSHTLGVSFANELVFDQFKAWFANQTAPISSSLPQRTNRLLAAFQKLKLDGLTVSLNLRRDPSDGNDEFSFARVLAHCLVKYMSVEPEPNYGLLPFSLEQALVPETVVFVNVSQHKQAHPHAISKEWDTINNALASPIRIVSNHKLSQMTAATKAAQMYANQAAGNARDRSFTRMKNVPFRKRPLSAVDMYRYVKKVLEKMEFVAQSQNITRVQRPTFQKANRRRPDDFNLPGKATIVSYKPDLHLYLDTSGSISQDNYESMVKACIMLAKKLDINLYFNSFSTVLSQTTLLKTKGRTPAQIYKQFCAVHKVDGGTDYEPIWNFINASPTRKRELSIIVTDFMWYAPSHYVEHPANLYYMPCSNMNWSDIMDWAERFAKTMHHIDPRIRSKILM